MTFIERTFIFLIITLRTIYTETFNCDGNNLVCMNQPITCTDNESCLITCTGAGDCIGTTITCPTNGDCTIECHNSATTDGCQASSIIATNSLSLSIDNQGVDKGFQSVPIYCPLNGNCTLYSSGGNKAFESVQIYSIYGFVFNQISISCSAGQCNKMTMHCGNNYISSCNIDTSTGNMCKNGPLTCDTIFTSITNNWTDNYSINPAPGWIVTDFNNNSINNTFIGTYNTYHGPFYGNADGGSLDKYSLTQYFYCSITSYVYVEYTYGFSCQETTDYSRLYLNNQLVADKHADKGTGQGFLDDALELAVHDQCPDSWKRKYLNGSLGEIQANTLFKVEITVTLNYDQEASTITDFQIICQPPTNSPTNSPITAAPTMVNVVTPTTSPTTINPTTSPITHTPTNTPTTGIPTVHPTTDIPTETTNEPSDSPTLEPTMDSISPSMHPSEPSKAPNRGKGSNGNGALSLRPTQQYHTLSTDNVNKKALWIVIGVIGSFFVIVVLIALKIFYIHEKDHRPLYFERTQEMMKESIVSNDNIDGNMVENDNNKGNINKMHTHGIELNTMSEINAIDTFDGGDDGNTGGYIDYKTNMD